eukprot:385467-Amorphochlora_amoeboformis.AAC.1
MNNSTAAQQRSRSNTYVGRTMRRGALDRGGRNPPEGWKNLPKSMSTPPFHRSPMARRKTSASVEESLGCLPSAMAEKLSAIVFLGRLRLAREVRERLGPSSRKIKR